MPEESMTTKEALAEEAEHKYYNNYNRASAEDRRLVQGIGDDNRGIIELTTSLAYWQ